MHYRIDGENLPVLKITLEQNEGIDCEAGAMSWMDDEIEMQTSTGGGIGKMFGRMLTNEKAFMNRYIARRPGEIAFSSKFPGSIRAVRITPDNGLIIQKGSFLACAGNISNEVYIQKRLSGGFFGGEGCATTTATAWSSLKSMDLPTNTIYRQGTARSLIPDISRRCRIPAVWK